MAVTSPLLERDFQKQVVHLFQLGGWGTYSVPDSRRASMSGYPDLTMWSPDGRLIFAELKREKGRVRPEQIVTLSELARCVDEVYLWYPSDLDEIVKLVKTKLDLPLTLWENRKHKFVKEKK